MTDISIASTPAQFKAAAMALITEGQAGITQSRWRQLAQEDQEIRRRWRAAHGRDDGLSFARAVPFEQAGPDPRSP